MGLDLSREPYHLFWRALQHHLDQQFFFNISNRLWTLDHVIVSLAPVARKNVPVWSLGGTANAREAEDLEAAPHDL
jgi:hypothetical protein